MASLNEKLKKLGVQVGTGDISKPAPAHPYSIQHLLKGKFLQTPAGDIYVIDSTYPIDYIHGNAPIKIDSPPKILGDWAGDSNIEKLSFKDFGFIDIETTGLSGGTGTYAFLIGAGRFLGNKFKMCQFFMSDPVIEPAQLLAFEEFIAPCKVIVTFNGKSFDVPILNTRYTYHGYSSPLNQVTHLDLVHLSRRIWRDRIPSRTLSNLEVQILNAQRTDDDIPGWMIPALYFEYLKDGDARQLKRVFYHNEIDVLSLSALFNYLTTILKEQNFDPKNFSSEIIAIAKLFEDTGDIEKAENLYKQGLINDDDKLYIINASYRLAMIFKRKGDFNNSVFYWKKSAFLNHLESKIELAKYFEHQVQDFEEAIYWTKNAVKSIKEPDSPDNLPFGITNFNKDKKQKQLIHRLNRLERKIQG